MQNYQKKAWVTQLQKSVNTLSDAFQLMMIDENTGNLEKTKFMSLNDTPERVSILQKYMKIDKWDMESPFFKWLGSPLTFMSKPYCQMKLYLADGTTVYLGNSGTGWENNYIFIDVNGDKKPNQLGRDAFLFSMSKSGDLVVPYGYTHWATDNLCNPDSNASNGEGFAARIIENGWKMDY